MATDSDETSVQVALRIRPQIPREIIDMCRVCTKVIPDEQQVVIGDDKSFTYDFVFDTNVGQEDIYDACVHKLVTGSLKGYNATVLAYGQTGSGKTYTMGTGFDVEISDSELGIIPRAIRNIFRGIDEIVGDARNRNDYLPEFRIDCQFTEIYNEEIIDLFDSLNYNKKLIKIHEDIQGDINLSGAIQNPVLSVEDALEYLKVGALSRRTASTQMNSQSSRSHAIFTLLIRHQRVIKDDDNSYAAGASEYETLTSKFHFVDLAGSERLKRTGATGERAKEGISINCGLLALGNVISALAARSKKSHIPYRDSKLTRLLQDSLGGNSQTLMIACVSPSDRDFMETLNTMKYANRAKNIKNKVVVNQDKSSRVISSLRQEIAQLQLELMEYKQGIRVLNSSGNETYNDIYVENKMLQSELNSLRTKIKAMQETINAITNKNSELLINQVMWTKRGASEADTNITEMVQGYLKEIEDLRVKLMESELISESLRKQLARMQTNNRSHNSSNVTYDGDTMTASVIECAKHELELEKSKLNRFVGHHDTEKDLDDLEFENDRTDDDNNAGDNDALSSELAELSTNITMKQKLVEQLELSQKRIQTLKKHYESKLLQLQEKINDTEAERDKVLASFTSNPSNESKDRVKKVKDTYEKKLNDMQRELRQLHAANKEHNKMVRNQSQQENQLQSLKNELIEMKRMKVKVINQMKEETQRHKDLETRRVREIAQLQKESRKNAKLLQIVEADRRQKEQILKRKQEEVIALRKVQRERFSPGSPTHLPKVFQNKWQNVESSIRKIVLNRQVVANEERDMNRFLARRKELGVTLSQLRKQKALALKHGDDTNTECDTQIDTILDELNYIQEKITESQHNIVHYEECKDAPDVSALIQSHLKSVGSMSESRFFIEKLLGLAINQSIQNAQREVQLQEKDVQIEQMRDQYELHSRLLDSIVPMHFKDLLSSQTSNSTTNDNASTSSSASSSSSDSTRATSPIIVLPPLSMSNSYTQRLTSARQKRYPKKRDDLLGLDSSSDSSSFLQSSSSPKFSSLSII